MSFFGSLLRGAGRFILPIAQSLAPVARNVLSQVPSLIGDIITGRPANILGAIRDVGTSVLGDFVQEAIPTVRAQLPGLVSNIMGQNPFTSQLLSFAGDAAQYRPQRLQQAMEQIGRMTNVPTFSQRTTTNTLPVIANAAQYSRGGTPLENPFSLAQFGSSGLDQYTPNTAYGTFNRTGFGQQVNPAQIPNQPMAFTPNAFASFNQQYVAPGGRSYTMPVQPSQRSQGEFDPNQLISQF